MSITFRLTGNAMGHSRFWQKSQRHSVPSDGIVVALVAHRLITKILYASGDSHANDKVGYTYTYC